MTNSIIHTNTATKEINNKHQNSLINARIAGVRKHSSVNGPGVRYVLFMQGCPHDCEGCQNPETHDETGGTEISTDSIAEDILNTKYIDGITFSGGDPLMQPDAVIDIVRKLQSLSPASQDAKPCGVASADMQFNNPASGRLKSNRMNTWLYTGWTWEQLMAMPLSSMVRKAITYIDVIVDGRFEKTLMSEECLFRGSTNQRLIDVYASLAEGKPVPYIFTHGI